MSFFAKLFGKRGASKKEQNQKSFSEKDNMGTRQDTLRHNERRHTDGN